MPHGLKKLTGIDAETIRGLARQMAANRTQIIAGWCVQRMQHGEQWAWMIVVLAAMLGANWPARWWLWFWLAL